MRVINDLQYAKKEIESLIEMAGQIGKPATFSELFDRPEIVTEESVKQSAIAVMDRIKAVLNNDGPDYEGQ
jgi:hypothetical protein